MLQTNEHIPSLIKYMGSKAEIIEYIILGINGIFKEKQVVCDLFSGSATLSGALRGNKIHIISNDIQQYSEVLAKVYLSNYDWDKYPNIDDIIKETEYVVEEWKNCYQDYWNEYDYSIDIDFDKFQNIENKQRELKENNLFIGSIENNPSRNIRDYHLFTKYYSGTYWSFRQCIWIDSLRTVADKYTNIPEYYNALLACIMYAMAYNSQSTGHYAQYRKATNQKSMDDVLIYRRKSMLDFFKRKYNELREQLFQQTGTYNTLTLSYDECIDTLPQGTLVYADPPYCSVHYSRFYHILETFVKYDYPEIKYDGRYREDRHQSPFCIGTKVEGAFINMFNKLKNRQCELVLSYSNSSTTMIDLQTILINAYSIFNGIDVNCIKEVTQYIQNVIEEKEKLELEEIDVNISILLDKLINVNSEHDIILKMFKHKHSTLGRIEVKSLDVLETLILVKKRG